MAYENVTPPALPEYNTVTKCLYKGVELPKLPVVDGYSYHVIRQDTNNGRYDAIYATSKFSANVLSGETQAINMSTTKVYSMPLDKSSEWSYRETNANAGYSFDANRIRVYSNDDIYTSKEMTEVYFAGSAPVPVLDYPYHVLVFDYGAKESDWHQVHLYYSATAFTYNGSAVTNAGVVFKQVYDDRYGAWADFGELSEAVRLSPGLDDGMYQRIYTNHGIFDTSGKVWLAAGSVTPVGVTEEWLRSFKIGLSLGLCGNAIFGKGEPVPDEPVEPDEPDEPIGYFQGRVARAGETADRTIDGVGYVGEVLPDVYSVNGSWQNPVPYRIVYKQGDEFRLVLFPYAFSYITEDGASYITTIGGASATAWIAYYATERKRYWWKVASGNNTTSKLLIPTENIVWTSHDLLYENSTDIFLAASDCVCIPIYE